MLNGYLCPAHNMAAASNHSTLRTPPTRPAPVAVSSRIDAHLRLSEEARSLADITKEKQLPCVIKCDPATVTQSSVPLDLTQPLLVYTKRSVRKVAARSVIFNKVQGRYVETEDDILVPEDYIGWFGVMGHSTRMQVEGNIPHYRTVNKLAISACTVFLVAGNTSVKAFTRVSKESEWVPHEVAPGEVLRKGDLCQARQELTRKGGKKSKHKSKSSKGDNISVYLRCYDDKDREILIHGMAEGVFYILAQDGAPLRAPVYNMKNILQRYKFPLLVKLLYGPIPSTPCAFKDTLLLTESSMNHTVLASTVNNLRNINLEIPLDTDMLFYVAESTQALTQSRQYQQAVAECRAKVPGYMRNMKVLFGAIPGDRMSSTDSTSSASPPPSPRQPASISRTPSGGSGGEPSPHIRLRERTPKESRMNVISRIITLNLEDQSIFTPNIPPSPSTLLPQSKQGLSLKRSSKEKEAAVPAIPGSLAAISDFVPPPNPEIIRGAQIRREVSEEGKTRLEAFRKQQRQEIGAYETPNDLSIPGQNDSEAQNDMTERGQYNTETRNDGTIKGQYETPNEIFQSREEDEDDTNSNPYGSVWDSVSLRESRSARHDHNTESVVAIEVACKPGKPVSPTNVIFEEKNTDPPMSDSWESFTGKASSSLDSNNNGNSSFTDTAEVDAQNDHPLVQASDFPPPPSWLLGPCHSDLTNNADDQPANQYNTTHTDRMSHVYNELVDHNDNINNRETTLTCSDGYMNQRQVTLTPDVPSSTATSVYANDTLLGMVRPLPSASPSQANDLSSTATNQTEVGGYEEPNAIWRRTSTPPSDGNKLARSARGMNSDSGIYDGEDVSASTLEDPYDQPSLDTGQTYVHPTLQAGQTYVHPTLGAQQSTSIYSTVIELEQTSTATPSNPSSLQNPPNPLNPPNPPNYLNLLDISNTPNPSSLMEELQKKIIGNRNIHGSQPQPTTPDGARSDGSRPDGARSDGSRSDGSRSDGSRPDGARSYGSRPDGARSDPPFVSGSPVSPQEDGPPLPLNHPPKAVNIKSPLEMLSRVKVQAQAPASSRKDALLAELKQAGIKPSSQLALGSLQAADFVLLSQTSSDKIDDVLLSLLPSIGRIDLRKIAMCVKNMGIYLDNN